MAGYSPTQISKPANEQDFERKAVVLFREIVNDPNLKRYARRGQGQQGVDLIGKRDGNAKRPVGIQCKLKGPNKKLSEAEIRREVRSALKFKPSLSEYYIITTAPNDGSIEQLALRLQQEQAGRGRQIQIEVWGWETLQDRISESEAASNAFDPGFSPSVKKANERLHALQKGQEQQATRAQVEQISARLERHAVGSVSVLPAEYADQELGKELSRALRRRGFAEANWSREIGALAERVTGVELGRGSVGLRTEVFRRAARAHAQRGTLAEAERFYGALKAVDPNGDAIYAGLFADANGHADEALRQLRSIDDPIARGRVLNILLREKGVDDALVWLRTSGIGYADLSAHAIANIVHGLIESGRYDEASGILSELPRESFRDTPILHLLRAQLFVAASLPADQQAIVFQGLPLNPRMLQVASDPSGRAKLKQARGEIAQAMSAVEALGLPQTASYLREFDLWLQLEDAETRAAAREALAAELGDPKRTLQSLRLALAYGVPFDKDALNAHLRRQREVGGWTQDERFAAFLLAFVGGDAVKVAAFFDEFRGELFKQEPLPRAMLADMEVKTLAHARRFQEAKDRLTQHIRDGSLEESQRREIEQEVDALERGDETEHLRKRYVESQDPKDLRMLVGLLANAEDYRRLAEFAPTLARYTKQKSDFGLAVQSLYHQRQYAELLALCDDLPEIAVLDDEFESLKAWALFTLGRIMEARTIARELYRRRANNNDRELCINTAIESGDWGYIQTVIGQEIQRKDKLDADTLMRMARLAFEVGSLYVDQFRDAALEKAGTNPEIYLAAYSLAVERGIEVQDARSHEWFQKALALSGPDGPVQSVDLKELVERNAGWNRHVEEVDRSIRQAAVPLFAGARALRRQPLDLLLGQALRNRSQSDPRGMSPIPCFSGKRQRVDISSVSTIALDISAIIVLDFLGILTTTLQAFDRVVIAPTTLSALLVERQFLRNHQPSEQARAERIKALMSNGGLKVFAQSVQAPAELVNEVGSDLAEMLASAAQQGAVVLASAPISKVGSFLNQAADLEKYQDILVDTHAALTLLSASGQIDTKTKEAAQAYLNQVDKRWPKVSPLSADSTVYLDDLAATYLDYTHLLGPLCREVKAVFVSKEFADRADAQLEYASHSKEVVEAIERTQSILNQAIERGRISFGTRRLSESDDEENTIISRAPSLDLVTDLTGVDVIIADDRYMNKEDFWSDGKRRVPCFSTLDVIGALYTKSLVSVAGRDELFHRLRIAGFCEVSVTKDEIVAELLRASIAEEAIVETPELRAIRESISLPRRARIYLSAEGVWLQGIRFSLLEAIRAVWSIDAPEGITEARADWILRTLGSPIDWCLQPENPAAWDAVLRQEALQAAFVLLSYDRLDKIKARYAKWSESRIVMPMRADRPWLWELTAEVTKELLSQTVRRRDGATA